MSPWSAKKEPSRELVLIDDVVAACPYIVRRDNRIIATFARKALAEEFAQGRSWHDESLFVVRTASEVIASYRDGEETS
jgi:hypothetical protein